MSTDSTISPLQTQVIAGRPRLNFLEGIRGIAAFYVVLGHSAQTAFPYRPDLAPPTGLPGYFSFALLGGHYAVTVFIVLSGFCLMLPVIQNGMTLKGGIPTFMKRRARRILPPYYVALGLTLLLIWLVVPTAVNSSFALSIPVTRSGFISHLFLVHDFYTPRNLLFYQINGPMWSVAVEFQIYLFFPLLVWMWQRLGGGLATAISGVFAVFLIGVIHFSPVKVMCPDYVAMFAIGACGAVAANSREAFWTDLRRWMPWRSIAVITISLACLIGFRLGQDKLYGSVIDLLISLAAVSLLVSISDPHPTMMRTITEWKPLVFVGTFSYSLYLIHAPLVEVCWQYIVRPLHLSLMAGFGMMVVTDLLLILPLAYLFFMLAERPFLSAHRKTIAPGAPAPLPAGTLDGLSAALAK